MKHFVITIGREFGCNAREIGRQLASRLGVKFYDKELVDLASEKLGLESTEAAKGFFHERIYIGSFSGRRYRRRTRRNRGGAGVGPARGPDRAVYPVPGRHREYALQSLHRRHRQGPSGAGAGRAGRPDGPRGGRDLPAEPDAEPWQRPGGAQPAGAD